ncbi:hypothetical protein AHF37_03388 [Paragonimus kellicotti]|nr:hypothetical protein AHF37_03388 [Paragonimus kellicotti]
MTFCTRFERRTFLLTASTDCSVALWTLYGAKVGVFGQELRWKLELVHRDAGMVSLASTDTSPVQVPTDGMLDEEETKDPRDSTESIATPVPEFRVDNIEPFPEDAPLNDICSILSGYRINAWKHTMLGKEYQEVRIAKRQRKQPQTITDLPSVAGERYGKPNYGPYCYLQLSAFDPVEELEQPDFMDRPEEYFMDKDDLNSLSNPVELPVLENSNGNTHDQHNVYNERTLKHAIDEQSFFPSYLLHFDEQMKRTNKFLNGRILNESSQTHGYHFDDTTISDLTSSQATRAPSSRSSRLPPIKHTKSNTTVGLSQKSFR